MGVSPARLGIVTTAATVVVLLFVGAALALGLLYWLGDR
jgi:hypothetical protein